MVRFILTFIAMFIVLNCSAYHKGDKVELAVMNGCGACEIAEYELTGNHISFTTIPPTKESRGVPQLFVNGRYVGMGVFVVEEYINAR